VTTGLISTIKRRRSQKNISTRNIVIVTATVMIVKMTIKDPIVTVTEEAAAVL
jgi:hypothetical protein